GVGDLMATRRTIRRVAPDLEQAGHGAGAAEDATGVQRPAAVTRSGGPLARRTQRARGDREGTRCRWRFKGPAADLGRLPTRWLSLPLGLLQASSGDRRSAEWPRQARRTGTKDRGGDQGKLAGGRRRRTRGNLQFTRGNSRRSQQAAPGSE